MEVKHLGSDSFDGVLNTAGKDILIDFWAEWCGPCKMMGPVLEDFAQAHPDWIVGKVNVDQSMDLAVKYTVDAIPALFHFRDGKILHRFAGYMKKEDLEKQLGL